MKKYVKQFICRGSAFAWGGPIILAIVWLCLKNAGVVSMLSVNEVVLGIVSTTVMAFIAAGVSIVYQIEKLPKSFAGLIQASVLYIDYLGFYLINGWIPWDKVWLFTLIFVVIFIAIWLGIYVSMRIKINKINKMIN